MVFITFIKRLLLYSCNGFTFDHLFNKKVKQVFILTNYETYEKKINVFGSRFGFGFFSLFCSA